MPTEHISASNKALVRKTQEVLKKLGYEVKLTHVYELYSQLAGFNSWNVAKVKDASFEDARRAYKEARKRGCQKKIAETRQAYLGVGARPSGLYSEYNIRPKCSVCIEEKSEKSECTR